MLLWPLTTGYTASGGTVLEKTMTQQDLWMFMFYTQVQISCLNVDHNFLKLTGGKMS